LLIARSPSFGSYSYNNQRFIQTRFHFAYI